MQRIWFKYVILPLALCGIGLISTYFYLRTSLPQIDGELRVPGIAVPVEITRTEHGLAAIEANSMDDAWFGLGYAHAQDRLWQMMSMRRFALGRLSEVIGDDTVALDTRQRRLGFGRFAQAQFEELLLLLEKMGPSMQPHMPMLADLIIDASSIPRKDEFSDRIKAIIGVQEPGAGMAEPNTGEPVLPGGVMDPAALPAPGAV